MNEAPRSPGQYIGTSHHQLLVNASDCHRRNLIVRVGSVNAERTVAHCTVQQRNTGLLRRNHSRQELVRRAEHALAPLKNMGLVPLVDAPLLSAPHVPDAPGSWWSPSTWIGRLGAWLGYPRHSEGFRDEQLSGDPFGLRRAMDVRGPVRSTR